MHIDRIKAYSLVSPYYLVFYHFSVWNEPVGDNPHNVFRGQRVQRD